MELEPAAEAVQAAEIWGRTWGRILRISSQHCRTRSCGLWRVSQASKPQHKDVAAADVAALLSDIAVDSVSGERGC